MTATFHRLQLTIRRMTIRRMTTLPRNRRSRASFALVLIALFCVPAGAQVPIPGLGGDREEEPQTHARWEFSVEPAKVEAGGTFQLRAKYEVEKGWHLYAPNFEGTGVPTKVSCSSPSVEVQGEPKFPEPIVKKVEILNETHHLLEGVGTVELTLKVKPETPPGELPLPVSVTYQTCTDQICDMPATEEKTLKLDVTAAAPVKAEQPAASARREPFFDSIWALIIAMIGGGLFALVMPCTYPLIPVTVAFFTKQAEQRHGRVWNLAMCYGAGIIAFFVAIGLFFAEVIQDFAFAWGTNAFFAVLFFFFALSLFGLFEMRLPSFVTNWTASLSGKAATSSGTASAFAFVFLMGATLVVSSFTCTAPVMGPLLTFAIAGGSKLNVVIAMAAFGGTMAAPFVLLSLFPSRMHSLPRAGEWMHTLKVFFGFAELALALKFFSNVDLKLEWGILPRELFLVIWSAVWGVLGLYLLGLFKLRNEPAAGGIGPARMLVATVVVVFSMYCFWGSLGHRLDWVMEAFAPQYPAKGVIAGGSAIGRSGSSGALVSRQGNETEHCPGATWECLSDNPEKGLEVARRLGKPVLINFTGKL